MNLKDREISEIKLGSFDFDLIMLNSKSMWKEIQFACVIARTYYVNWDWCFDYLELYFGSTSEM